MKTVSVGNTDVQVGELRYGAYKKIKQAIITRLAENVLASIPSDVEKFNLPGLILAAKGSLPAIANILEELSLEFIKGCLLAEFNLDSCGWRDVEKLFKVAMELNPIEEILEAEKNSPAGTLARLIVSQVAGLASADGSQGSSQSLFDPAGE